MALRQYLRNNIVQIAKPFIDELRDHLKETVCLEIASGGTTVMAYAAEGTYRVRLAAPVGEILPPSSAGARKRSFRCWATNPGEFFAQGIDGI